MHRVIVPQDLYLIPSEEDDKFLLYRPSKHLVALLEPETAARLAAVLRVAVAEEKFVSSFYMDRLASLTTAGFLDVTQENLDSIVSTNSCGPLVREKQQPKLFSPHEVTLDITRKCNMRCIYCYASAGDTPISMPRACGRAAIDLCILNARRKGLFLGLHFHGGGEPSQEFDLLSDFCEYAMQQGHENNVEVKCSVITNGLIPPQVVDFYANRMDEITLSLDGDQIAHDQQRPSVNCGPTFKHVFETSKRFLGLKKKFNIRMTVTSKNVTRLEAITEFLISEFPGCRINVEPVMLVGRALGRNDLNCDPAEFADQVFAAMKFAMASGCVLFYSGVSGHSQRKQFCAASAPSFCVSADGSVTSCFSYSNRDIVRDLFVYGRYEPNVGTFSFDVEKMRRLQELTMDYDKYCDDCFCKTHCIGDCPAIRKFELTKVSGFTEKLDMDFMMNRRCATNRRIVRHLLNDLARGRLPLQTTPNLSRRNRHLNLTLREVSRGKSAQLQEDPAHNEEFKATT